MSFKHILLFFFMFFTLKNYGQSTASKQVTTFTINATQLNTIKQIWVYLPTNYKYSQKHYPVLYMQDGQNLFDTETAYAGEWLVDEYMDGLVTNESIVVGIEHGNEKRIDELTPYKHYKYGGGKGDAYLSFIKNTLKPYIDKTYRTLTDAKHTTLFGASLGGLISFYGVIKHPEIFGKAGVFSPSFWINKDIYDFVETTPIHNTLKFYFLVGTQESEEMVPDQKRMIALLKTKGVKDNQIVNQIIEGGQHNEKFWGTHFSDAYNWLYN